VSVDFLSLIERGKNGQSFEDPRQIRQAPADVCRGLVHLPQQLAWAIHYLSSSNRLFAAGF
jgi:hypothetical protein